MIVKPWASHRSYMAANKANKIAVEAKGIAFVERSCCMYKRVQASCTAHSSAHLCACITQFKGKRFRMRHRMMTMTLRIMRYLVLRYAMMRVWYDEASCHAASYLEASHR